MVALCLSIFLEAIQRFFDPQPVSNPKLIFIVGTFGLLSNILGLVLFHEHSHSHGHSHGHGHDHGAEPEPLATAEEGHNYGISSAPNDHPNPSAHQEENAVDGTLPREDSMRQKVNTSHSFNKSDEDGSTVAPGSPRKRRHPSHSKTMFPSPEDITVHPASFRNVIIAQSKLEDAESILDSDFEGEGTITEARTPTEETSLLSRHRSGNGKNRAGSPSHTVKSDPKKDADCSHKAHKHSQPRKPTKGGGNLNIRGVFLHVMGDALGNVGVMVSALVVQFWKSRYAVHVDPAISLLITCIILASAIPLCKAASRILLQAVPAGMDVDDIKEDIKNIPGILSCHHLHVWQLSDTKLVASLHIKVDCDVKGDGSARYMELAQEVQRCLHGYGIHSSTIQPEFYLDREPGYDSKASLEEDSEGSDRAGSSARGPKIHSARGSRPASKPASKPASTRGERSACLLQCGIECDERGQCCAPGLEDPESRNEAS